MLIAFIAVVLIQQFHLSPLWYLLVAAHLVCVIIAMIGEVVKAAIK